MAVNRKSKNEDCVLNQSTLEYANTFILFVSYGIFLKHWTLKRNLKKQKYSAKEAEI